MRQFVPDYLLLRRSAAAPLLMIGALGLFAIAMFLSQNWSVATLDTVFKDRVIPLRDLRDIESRIWSLRLSLPPGIEKLPETPPAESLHQTIEAVDRLWRSYLATYLTDEEKLLAARATESFAAVRQAETRWRDTGNEHELRELTAALLAFQNALEPVRLLQVRVAEGYYEESHARLRTGQLVAVPLILVALLGALGAVRASYRGLSRAERLLFYDEETGLLNQRGIRRDLGAGLARYPTGDYLAILMQFDSVISLQSLFGSSSVDSMMRALGLRLQELLGPQAVVARAEYAGIEIVVRDVEDVAATLARIEAVLMPPVEIFNVVVPVTWYGGYAVFPAQEWEFSGDHAPLAMLRAWSTRQRGFVAYTEAMHESLQASADLLIALKQAIDEERVFVELQPQVSLPDRRLLGAEALVRVRSPDGRRLSPATFIPFAEESGMIVRIGEVVRELVLATLREWIDEGLDFHISINLSVRELEVVSMAERFIERMEAHGVRAEQIVLEITESAFSLDDTEAQRNFGVLKQAGFRIAIDDFGTGESSLGRLAAVHVHELKIDRSLVRQLPQSERARTVTRLCCEVGQALDCEMLAEGVETEAECRIACDLGARRGQGWLFGRPMPPDDFRVLARAARRLEPMARAS